MDARTAARVALGGLAGAGALWWVAVPLSDDVRRLTLGGIEPALLAGPDLVLFVGASTVAAARAHRGAAAVAAGWTVLVTGALLVHTLLTREAGWGATLMVAASLVAVPAAAVMWWWPGRPPLGWFFTGPFRFRPAADRTSTGHVARSLAQLVVFWSTFLVGVPLLLAWGERRLRVDAPVLDGAGWTVAGIVVFVVGSAGGLWSCLTMAVVGRGTPLPADTAAELVIAGPYRWVRNPMAVCGAAQTVGVGLIVGSWSAPAAAVVGGLAWDRVIRPTEEADLLARFGADYARYRSRVRCWLPTRPGPDGPSTDEVGAPPR